MSTVLFGVTPTGEAKACSNEPVEAVVAYANSRFPTTGRAWRIVADAPVEDCWSEDGCLHYVLDCR